MVTLSVITSTVTALESIEQQLAAAEAERETIIATEAKSEHESSVESIRQQLAAAEAERETIVAARAKSEHEPSHAQVSLAQVDIAVNIVAPPAPDLMPSSAPAAAIPLHATTPTDPEMLCLCIGCPVTCILVGCGIGVLYAVGHL